MRSDETGVLQSSRSVLATQVSNRRTFHAETDTRYRQTSAVEIRAILRKLCTKLTFKNWASYKRENASNTLSTPVLYSLGATSLANEARGTELWQYIEVGEISP
jgi:hypothetical protein